MGGDASLYVARRWTPLAKIGVQVTFMDKDSWKFLQELCDIPGPPGFEAGATRLMKDYADRNVVSPVILKGAGAYHHFIPAGLVAEVEGDRVRLSANADVAVTFEEEEGGEPV